MSVTSVVRESVGGLGVARSVIPQAPRAGGVSRGPEAEYLRGGTATQVGRGVADESEVVTETIVLKFGGSVLQHACDVDRVVDEIYRWVRRGHKVVCVVSALEGQTDALLAKARAFGEEPCPVSTALLLSTGELQSAALLGLALRKAGIHSLVVPVSAIRLRSLGEALDAELASVDLEHFARLIAQHGVVVVPGFTGVGKSGTWQTLGRGGSDLTALFLAKSLGATCRLIKDVDGLYEWDPKVAPAHSGKGRLPRRYRRLAIDAALKLGGDIVQEKALRFVRQHEQVFSVASLGAEDCTVVTPGDERAVFDDGETRREESRGRLRASVLGLGTVGEGVVSHLAALGERFEIAGVLVRDVERGQGVCARLGVPPEVVSGDWRKVIAEADVVVEVIGGCEPSREILVAALEAGKHVVTANKAVLAAHGPQLREAARLGGATLRYSAAVGGAATILETAKRLREAQDTRAQAVTAIAGILNGTTNFVLQETLKQTRAGWSRREAFAAAVKRAQELGFAEADPSRDLDGLDLADKLVVLVHEAAGIELRPEEIDRRGLSPEGIEAALRLCPTGWTIRYIAEVVFEGGGVRASIGLRPVPLEHVLANIEGAFNGAVFARSGGGAGGGVGGGVGGGGGEEALVVRGQGAGRWPTARAVLADVLDVARVGGRV